MEKVRLDGKTVIVTGGNAGIGKETARELAKRGARVVLACRSEGRGEEARREIIESSGNDEIIYRHLDLSSLESVKIFAQQFNEEEERLDILVNNAGVMTAERKETTDGHEMHFGVNHLGHFYLTYLLLDKLKASAPSRIVCVSSMAHKYGKLDFKDLEQIKSFGTFQSYGRSKTANILMSVHLAKLLEGTGVTTYSLHPGSIKTEIGKDLEGLCFIRVFTCLYKCCPCCMDPILTPEQGAATTLYCCLEPSIAKHTGRYYSESVEKKASSHATDPVLAERLWNKSLELCHITSNK